MMMKQSLYIAVLVPLLASVVACGGGGGDDVNITNEFGNTNPVDPVDPPDPGDCALIVPADFASFNPDCSVGTLSGTIDENYTLISEVQWRLEGTVTVGTGNQTVDNAGDVQAVRDAGLEEKTIIVFSIATTSPSPS